MASGSASTRGGTSTKESRAARRSKLLRGSGGTTFQTSNPNAPNFSPF